MGKALRILTIVAVVVAAAIVFAPASSFVFKAAMWLMFKVLIPLSQIPVIGAAVPIGAFGTPSWNPDARGGGFGNSYQSGGGDGSFTCAVGAKPADCVVGTVDVVDKVPWYRRWGRGIKRAGAWVIANGGESLNDYRSGGDVERRAAYQLERLSDELGHLGPARGIMVPRTAVGTTVSAARNSKPVVIGETMGRVIDYAKGHGATWYNARGTNPANWMRNNMQWLRRQVQQGRTIIDIGEDPLRSVRSLYYKAEKELLRRRGYPTKKP